MLQVGNLPIMLQVGNLPVQRVVTALRRAEPWPSHTAAVQSVRGRPVSGTSDCRPPASAAGDKHIPASPQTSTEPHTRLPLESLNAPTQCNDRLLAYVRKPI